MFPWWFNVDFSCSVVPWVAVFACREAVFFSFLLIGFWRGMSFVSPVKNCEAFSDLLKWMCLLLISYSLLERNSKIVCPLLIMQIQVGCWQPLICFSCSYAEFSSLSTFSHFCRVWTAFCSCSIIACEGLLLLPVGVQSRDQPQGESVWVKYMESPGCLCGLGASSDKISLGTVLCYLGGRVSQVKWNCSS